MLGQDFSSKGTNGKVSEIFTKRDEYLRQLKDQANNATLNKNRKKLIKDNQSILNKVRQQLE